MKVKSYTVLEIAQKGKEKFGIDLEDTGALEKQIRLAITRENIQPVGRKKSTPTARNDANAYSEVDKDRILDDFLFDYLRSMSNDEAVKKFKSSAEYQKMADEANEEYFEGLKRWQQEEEERARYGNFDLPYSMTEDSERVNKKKYQIISDALVDFYLHDKVDWGGEEALGKAAFLSQILNSQFVAENLFSRLFDFKIDELVEDMNRIDYVQDELIGGDLGAKEMKLFDKLSNWRNYASLKREYM